MFEKEEDIINLVIKGKIVKEVNDFKYLSVHESANKNMDLEIDKRITLMRIANRKRLFLKINIYPLKLN